MAEGLFQAKVEEAGLSHKIKIDSCGTGGWHEGELPDRRMRATAKRHGLQLTSRARQIRGSDLFDFDYILAMDRSNFNHILQMKFASGVEELELFLMRYFDELGQNKDVPDPYYGGERGFEDVYQMLDRSCAKLLAHIREKHSI